MEAVASKPIIKNFISSNNPKKMLLTVAIASIILGTLTGYIISNKKTGSMVGGGVLAPTAKNAQTDNRTFKDFAEGVIKAKPAPADGEYTEGTHTLVRDGALPVALTSSVVDLSQYEGKKVKVYGETQKALKEGWLMDIGKVEEVK